MQGVRNTHEGRSVLAADAAIRQSDASARANRNKHHGEYEPTR
jgi:hypothetical protein